MMHSVRECGYKGKVKQPSNSNQKAARPGFTQREHGLCCRCDCISLSRQLKYLHESQLLSRNICFNVMEDAVRPNEQAFKAMYERGYCTWFSLYEMTIADTKTNLPWWDCLFQLENAFSRPPFFPRKPCGRRVIFEYCHCNREKQQEVRGVVRI